MKINRYKIQDITNVKCGPDSSFLPFFLSPKCVEENQVKFSKGKEGKGEKKVIYGERK